MHLDLFLRAYLLHPNERLRCRTRPKISAFLSQCINQISEFGAAGETQVQRWKEGIFDTLEDFELVGRWVPEWLPSRCAFVQRHTKGEQI